MSSVRKLPGLDTIMVFVYAPMSMDIFSALGAVPQATLLDLTSRSVDDVGFGKFHQFSTVETLLLNHSQITDASTSQILKYQHVSRRPFQSNNRQPYPPPDEVDNRYTPLSKGKQSPSQA